MNEVNAKCRIGLTGTAIQNDYDELWSLLHWTNPLELGSARDWSSMISEPLKQGQSHDATLAQLGKARAVAERLVHNLLPRFFLRRTKLLIADQLPRKFDVSSLLRLGFSFDISYFASFVSYVTY